MHLHLDSYFNSTIPDQWTLIHWFVRLIRTTKACHVYPRLTECTSQVPINRAKWPGRAASPRTTVSFGDVSDRNGHYLGGQHCCIMPELSTFRHDRATCHPRKPHVDKSQRTRRIIRQGEIPVIAINAFIVKLACGGGIVLQQNFLDDSVDSVIGNTHPPSHIVDRIIDTPSACEALTFKGVPCQSAG